MRTLQNTSASSPKDPKTWMNYNWGAAFRTGQDGKEGYRIAWLSHHCSDFDGDSGLCGAICKNSLAAEFFELYEAERAQYFANKNSGASQD